MAQIEYDDGDVKDVASSRCQIYHGLLPTAGLYITIGTQGYIIRIEDMLLPVDTTKIKIYMESRHDEKK